jgi:cell division protein FtsB
VRTTWLVPIVLLAVAGVAIADGESGLPMWLRLRGDVEQADRRVAVLVRETQALQSQIDALAGNPFALEQAIREDLELALPGEIVVRFDPHRGRDW